MELRTRHATMDDLTAITAVEAECFPAAEAAPRESFRARLEVYPEFFWLLEGRESELEDWKLISFVNGMVTVDADLRDEMFSNAALHAPDGDWQMIFGVATLPNYQRQGYAGRLLRQAIADAKEQGRKGVVLTCKEQKLHYYAKFGFVNEGVSESEHGQALWYQMRILFRENA